MVKFWEGSTASNTMNFTRPPIPKGNKLFLPKIEYAKLTDAREFDSKNIERVSPENEKSSEDFENLEKVPLLNNDYSLGNFTRFSVLPPIKDGVRGTRRLSRALRFSPTLFGSENGPGPESKNGLAKQQMGDYRSQKSAEYSSEVFKRLHRGSRADDKLVKDLQVVGKQCVSDKRETRQIPGQGKCNARRQKAQRSFSSPTSSEGYDSNCQGCQMILMREHSKTEGAKLMGKLVDRQSDSATRHVCSKGEKFSRSVLRGANSDNVLSNKVVYELSRNNKPNQNRYREATLSPNPQRTNLLAFDFHPGVRPVSRCEISVDVNEGEQTPLEKHIVELPSKHGGGNPNEPRDVAANDKEIMGSNGTPQIQILIDSIDSAKEELPKASKEIPYTSAREQRRRSALCRNNSKQVDDFLLVHNLRDLGLL